MRKWMAWLLVLFLLAAAAGIDAEESESVFAKLSGLEWSFCSGVGGWSTDMRILADGTFSGEFHDSEMGEAADEYPFGTVYGCSFMGKMSVIENIDENTWRIRVDALRPEEGRPDEAIDGGVRYVKADCYGLSEQDEMLLFAPGTPTEDFSEDMLYWTHIPLQDPPAAHLDNWYLYSAANESGFVGYETDANAVLPNPWEEMTAEELMEASGLSFGVPEGAEQVVYRFLRDENLAEMQFILDGDEYCARLQPAALAEGEWMEITDMYFAWENEEDVMIHHCKGTIGQAKCGSEDWVERCLWYDAAPGLMGSLAVSTNDLDGLDLTAVAEQVYIPVQGED